jgi:hypothetical protein
MPDHEIRKLSSDKPEPASQRRNFHRHATLMNFPCNSRRRDRPRFLRFSASPGFHEENDMLRKQTLCTLALTLSIAFAAPVMAQGAKGNASGSAGATNADVMAPGATGATTPTGAGDVSASGVSNGGNKAKATRHPKASRSDKTAPATSDGSGKSGQTGQSGK